MSYLAHAADAVTQPFDSDFYTTIATVIPVFLLAFAVQKPNPLDNFLQVAVEATRRALRAVALTAWLAVILAFVLIFAGFWSEYLALDALYNQAAATHQQRTGMLVTTLAFTLGVIAVPMLQTRIALSASDNSADPADGAQQPGSRAEGKPSSGKP